MIDNLIDNPVARRAAGYLAGLAAFYWILQRLWPAPAGVILKGMVIGGLYSLIALGVALVYRANRVINFAQGDLGGAPAILAILLIVSKGWPYPIAIGAGLVAGLAAGVVVEFLFIRPFRKAPRLILTVVTIALAQVLSGIELLLPRAFNVDTVPQNFPSPFNFSFAFHKVQFQGNDVLAMVAVPLCFAALAWFLNRTNMGVAIRACSESADRASLLGVPVRRVNMVVWAIASLLATIALILRAGVFGLPLGSALGVSVLIPTLAAATIGRMENMPTIVGASLMFGVVEQSAVWHTGNADVVDLVSFVVIMAALFAQRAQLASRAEEAAMSTWTALREIRPIPPELKQLREVAWVRRAVGGVIAAVAVLLPFVVGEARTELAITLIVFMMVSLSLLVLTGWAGQISLGQFAFVGVGMTTGAWMTIHWNIDILLNLLLAGLVGAVVAVAIGIPALRIRGLYLAVATLAFTQACSSYFLNYTHFGWIPRQDDRFARLPVFGRIQIDTEVRYYFFCLTILAVCTLGVRGMRRSRIGRVLVAVRDNDRGVQAYGVNVVTAKLTAFALSGFLAAAAGVLLVHLQHALYPGSVDPGSSLKVFIMAVIGGLGSIPGVFAGAIYIQGLSWIRTSFPNTLRPIIEVLGSGLGVIFVLMFLPGGIGSVIFSVRDRLLRLLAGRKGIIVPSLVADAAQPESVSEEELAAAMAGGES